MYFIFVLCLPKLHWEYKISKYHNESYLCLSIALIRQKGVDWVHSFLYISIFAETKKGSKEMFEKTNICKTFCVLQKKISSFLLCKWLADAKLGKMPLAFLLVVLVSILRGFPLLNFLHLELQLVTAFCCMLPCTL